MSERQYILSLHLEVKRGLLRVTSIRRFPTRFACRNDTCAGEKSMNADLIAKDPYP